MSSAKKRPALVLASLDGNDVILCQITSRNIHDRYAIAISDLDFVSGSLRQESNIRPNQVFTADSQIIQYTAGHLMDTTTNRVIDRIIGILQE